MEDKKLNELNDEALDIVTGGASYQWNEKTGKFEVFDKDGKKIFSLTDEDGAKRVAASLSVSESMRDNKPSRAPWE